MLTQHDLDDSDLGDKREKSKHSGRPGTKIMYIVMYIGEDIRLTVKLNVDS